MRRPSTLILLTMAVMSSSLMGEGVKRTADVVYGRKAGMALTLDVFEPARKNGAAIVFIVSGGWLSSHDDPTLPHITPEYYDPYLARGYTVFAVIHSSQPFFTIPDMVLDLQRAVRFIRHNAGQWEIDRDRIGILGSSSGGHLALMVATHGEAGPATSPDQVDRESSAIQAAACFFPPTDFLRGGLGEEGTERTPESPWVRTFGGSLASTELGRQIVGRQISPIYFVTANLPPILIIHGEKDVPVPLEQSETFAAQAKEVGARMVKIVVRQGKGHGWPDFWKSQEDVAAFADWFDHYLGTTTAH